MASLCPSSAQQTSTTTAGVSPFAQNYVDAMLGAGQQQVFNMTPGEGGKMDITGIKPYQAYGSPVAGSEYKAGMGPGEQAAAQFSVAAPTALQQKAYGSALDMQTPGQYGAASQAAAQSVSGLLGAGAYQPSYFDSQYKAPSAYQAGQFSYGQVQAPQLQQYQMGPAERVQTQSFAQPGSAEAYMSPYMQNVVAAQQREAQRQSNIAAQGLKSQATKAGAFGGGRQAIMEAERQRNLATQLGDIQATGSQAAYQQAQQQFNQEQQARLAAQQANQQAGLTTGQQNLQSLLGVQQLGAGQNLQAQLANQQALQAAQQAAEQSRQFGYGQGMTGAQLAAQYGLAGQQATEASRQFGANLGLQGLQSALQGAGTLSNIGGQQLGAQQSIANLQNTLGQQEQANQQQVINQAMQNLQMQRMYPQQQLQYLSGLLSGLPVSSTGQVANIPGPNLLSQLSGAGLAGVGAYGLYNKFFPVGKKGGNVKSDPAGGIASIGLSKALNK